MARTISEIKKSMTEQYLADPVIREKYGLSDGDSFDDKFSKVSLENILFSVVATAIYALESIFDYFRADVENKINNSIVATIPWYHEKCLSFQHGDALVYNDTTKEYSYETIDESKRIIKYAAVRENGNGVEVLVSGDDNGTPVCIEDDVLTAFKSYLNTIKPAGILTVVKSYEPDSIWIEMNVQYDTMILNSDGSLITDSSVFPVEDAVKKYVAGIAYGGIFNKTKLMDAVQSVNGVKDAIVTEVMVKPSKDKDYRTVSSNNASSFAGSFVVDSIKDTVSYVQEL